MSGSDRLCAEMPSLRRFGDGEPVGHSGGKRMWQLADADGFVLAWELTPKIDPVIVEANLLREFRS